jgi:L-fucose isomerase-like protein
MYLLTSQPAGFGDFRDIEDGVLTIHNCGQHPPYFFGGPEDDSIKKLDSVEYMGQEIFYFAGGSSVRGRTPGGYTMTIARMARENLRYTLIATTIETINVPPEDHERFNFSWPLIRGKIPISDEEIINLWPCNHLGFAYGNLTPQLAEIAHRLNIGYRIFDVNGKEHFKPT